MKRTLKFIAILIMLRLQAVSIFGGVLIIIWHWDLVEVNQVYAGIGMLCILMLMLATFPMPSEREWDRIDHILEGE